jgi:heme exporter protein C
MTRDSSAFSPLVLAALAGGLGMAGCQWLVFVHAPLERTMGLVQKIFYIHLPVAWWGLISFFLSCLAGIAWLKSRDSKWDALSAAAAEVGMVCATLALATGCLWARRSWGVWWTWDPRLTTTLILWFIYAGYLALRSLPMPPERRSSLCAVVAIVGFLDVPPVFVSARLWRSIHPAVFASQSGGLAPEMAVAVIASVVCFGLIWIALLGLRFGQMRLQQRLDALPSPDGPGA